MPTRPPGAAFVAVSFSFKGHVLSPRAKPYSPILNLHVAVRGSATLCATQVMMVFMFISSIVGASNFNGWLNLQRAKVQNRLRVLGLLAPADVRTPGFGMWPPLHTRVAF